MTIQEAKEQNSQKITINAKKINNSFKENCITNSQEPRSKK
jgi:hypothetical protein